jgi:ABC-type transport system involved in cytochrome c biogenesis permease subunit
MKTWALITWIVYAGYLHTPASSAPSARSS